MSLSNIICSKHLSRIVRIVHMLNLSRFSLDFIEDIDEEEIFKDDLYRLGFSYFSVDKLDYLYRISEIQQGIDTPFFEKEFKLLKDKVIKERIKLPDMFFGYLGELWHHFLGKGNFYNYLYTGYISMNKVAYDEDEQDFNLDKLELNSYPRLDKQWPYEENTVAGQFNRKLHININPTIEEDISIYFTESFERFCSHYLMSSIPQEGIFNKESEFEFVSDEEDKLEFEALDDDKEFAELENILISFPMMQKILYRSLVSTRKQVARWELMFFLTKDISILRKLLAFSKFYLLDDFVESVLVEQNINTSELLRSNSNREVQTSCFEGRDNAFKYIAKFLHDKVKPLIDLKKYLAPIELNVPVDKRSLEIGAGKTDIIQIKETLKVLEKKRKNLSDEDTLLFLQCREYYICRWKELGAEFDVDSLEIKNYKISNATSEVVVNIMDTLGLMKGRVKSTEIKKLADSQKKYPVLKAGDEVLFFNFIFLLEGLEGLRDLEIDRYFI